MEIFKNIFIQENKDNKLKSGIKTIETTTILLEGPKVITNWKQNFNQNINLIKSLKIGDKLVVTLSDIGPGKNCQLRIGWGNKENEYFSWDNCYRNGVPYNYEITLKEKNISDIKSSGRLFLSGCNITIGKWLLTQEKEISTSTRGKPSIQIWNGSEIIDWNSSPKKQIVIDKASFKNVEENMKIRMYYKNMKLNSQGRIISTSNSPIPDADTFENLPKTWGNYYEFKITKDMLSELQSNGVIISGIGYTLISVEIIDPLKEYAITASFDIDDIKCFEKSDGIPKITVIIINNEEIEVDTSINATLITDMFTDYNNYSEKVKLSPGETKKIDLKFKDLKPGFYRMALNANGNSICNYNIGFDPTNIISPNDAQPDFWEFWDNWKKKLEEIEMKEEIKSIDDLSNGPRFIYEIKMISAPDKKDGEPVPIWGYYAEPKREGNYPCIINVHGTDNGTGIPQIPDTNLNVDWCEFNFSARGQMLSREKNGNPYKVKGETDFYSYGLGDNDNHYYRAAYLDLLRPLDFIWKRKKVDKNNIFVAGGSQGGCFSYVLAGLGDGKIKAIAPWITGHADFVHTMEIVGWPTNKFNDWINENYPDDYEEGKKALLKHQSYFDTKNFCSRIACPVTTNFSLQDDTDGPHLNIAPYNLLTKVAKEDKQYTINSFLGHSSKEGWDKEYMAFFKKYIDKEVVNISKAKFCTYYNSTAIQLPKGIKAATIDGINDKTKTIKINWRYDGDNEKENIIPGKTAVIIKGNEGNYKLKLLPDNKDKSPKGNILLGSDIRTITTGGEKYYKLSYGPADNLELKGKLGWYYGTSDGSAFMIEEHKAWLALKKEQEISKYFNIS